LNLKKIIELVEFRHDFLERIIDSIENRAKLDETESKKIDDYKLREEVLKAIKELLQEKLRKNKGGLEEGDIRKLFDKKFSDDKYKNNEIKPLEYIRKYTEGAENKILPDIMELDYEDIPDENGLSKFEVLETIQNFSNKISEIKEQERKLHTKLDCIVYAEQYLDTMDQLASLYHQKLFPKNATTYFQNHFGYGINLLNWYYEYVLDDYEEFDPKKEITQVELEYESKVREDRWIDFRWMCRGQDTRRKDDVITRFKYVDNEMSSALTTEIGNETTLPMTMYQFADLPEEESVDSDEISEIMRGYSTKLIDLNGKETSLKTKMDCAVYAEMYLDTLDQIAYLLNSKALATDSSTFFENNFSYGLTLKIWYDMMIANADEQESRWTEFLKYCDEFQDDEYVFKILTAFRPKEVLPSAMIFVEKLAEDSTQEIKSITYPKKGNELNYPEKYTEWENYYDKWVEDQRKINDDINEARKTADEDRLTWKKEIAKINDDMPAKTEDELKVKLDKKDEIKVKLTILDEIVYDNDKWLFKSKGFFSDLRKREHIQDVISRFIDSDKWLKSKKKKLGEEIEKIEKDLVEKIRQMELLKEEVQKEKAEKMELNERREITQVELNKLKEELRDL